MQILLANAKIMNESSEAKAQSVPMFQAVADVLAAEMARADAETMAQMLGCSCALALENCERYRSWGIAEKMPAIMAYNGQAAWNRACCMPLCGRHCTVAPVGVPVTVAPKSV